MIYAHSLFSSPVYIEENEINILVIENREYYQRFVVDFVNQSQAVSGEHLIFSGDDEIKYGKELDIITDLFNLDINYSKNLTKLYNEIKNDYMRGEHYEHYLTLSEAVNIFISNVVENNCFELDYIDNIDLVNVFKGVELKFCFDGKSIVEKLLDYMKFMSKFAQIKLFVIPQLKSTLSDNELELLYKELFYNKVKILVLESHDTFSRLSGEKYRIIDQDLCIID